MNGPVWLWEPSSWPREMVPPDKRLTVGRAENEGTDVEGPTGIISSGTGLNANTICSTDVVSTGKGDGKGEWMLDFGVERCDHTTLSNGRDVYAGVGMSQSSETYVCIEIRRCDRGLPPILKNCKGRLKWVVPHGDEKLEGLRGYVLNLLTSVLPHMNWGVRVFSTLNGHQLPAYQCVIREDDWVTIWDALMKPFAEMRVAYRRQLGGRNSPELLFGVTPKCEGAQPGVNIVEVEPEVMAGDAPSEPEVAGDPSEPYSRSSKRSESLSSDGISLPSASDWLDHWGRKPIPTANTFIDFANEIPPAALRRWNSMPDLGASELDHQSWESKCGPRLDSDDSDPPTERDSVERELAIDYPPTPPSSKSSSD